MSIADRLRSIPTLTGTAPGLDLARLPPDPVTLFTRWLDEAIAAEVPEPVAVTLATVDAGGVPDARTLILKDVDERGWAFAGEASSRKGEQLAGRPAAALSVYWQPQMRAVRVRGPVVEASPSESAADLAARSPAAQAAVAEGDWVLWRIRAERVELWQGSPDRQHIRIVYTRTPGAWEVTTGRGESARRGC